MSYRIIIHNRKYANWSIVDQMNNVIDNGPVFSPLLHKLFSGDVFDICDSVPKVTYSHIRSGIHIAGIILLDKIYSQTKINHKTPNKKPRHLYKCIPDDRTLPPFLVPMDNNPIGFNKKVKNKYVTFQFREWTGEYPIGSLTNTIGTADDLGAFYEYQLFCKSIHISITDFTNKTRSILQERSTQEYVELIANTPEYKIRDRTHIPVFSIDPLGSLDFDDAFSVQSIGPNRYIISIYIANVYVWLNTLDIWTAFSSRVSTIYLPDRKRPMLPTVLSDNLCSLQANAPRFAFTMDIEIALDPITQTPTIMGEPTFQNTRVVLYKNYVYDEPALFQDPHYQILYDITRRLSRNIDDSHDLVQHWMIYMNNACGQYMAENQIGIFRSVVFQNDPIHHTTDSMNPTEITSTKTRQVIEQWGNTCGQYITYSPDAQIEHQILKSKSYIHITSPIRRLVDLLNQMAISKHSNTILHLSPGANTFFDHWIKRMDYINQSMRAIKKVQTECDVLHRCTTDPRLLQQHHRGILFDKMQKNDGSYLYMVYLEESGILSRLICYEDIPNYSYRTLHMFLFEGEDKIQKKIRLQIV